MTWCLPEGESSSPQPTARIAKAITSSCFSVEVTELLESLECFIFVCDDAEVNCCEILQSKEDFIRKRRLTPSCALAVGFVSLRFVRRRSPKHHYRIRKGVNKDKAVHVSI